MSFVFLLPLLFPLLGYSSFSFFIFRAANERYSASLAGHRKREVRRMSLCFNWAVLDTVASDSIRRLIQRQLQDGLDKKGLSSASAAAARGGGLAVFLSSLNVTDLRWGHVPPFIEVLSMTDGHDFSSPVSTSAHPSARQRSGSSTPASVYYEQPPPYPSTGVDEASTTAMRFPRDASDPHLSSGSSQVDGSGDTPRYASAAGPSLHTNSVRNQHSPPRSGRLRRPPLAPSSSVHSSTDDIPHHPNHPPCRTTMEQETSMLTRLLGPAGLYTKLHLTYGGSMSLRVQVTVGTEIPVGASSGHRSSPPAEATPPHLLSPSNCVASHSTDGRPHAYHKQPSRVPASTPSTPHQSVPVQLPIEIGVGNLGIDCFVHVNIFNNELSVWLEPSVLSQSPLTKLSIQLTMGERPGGQPSPSLSAASYPQTPIAPFFDEQLISSMIVDELRGILAKSIVAPYHVSIQL